MRQAGVLAAAGIVALEQMVDRLEEDHQRAKTLAQKLSGLPGLTLDGGLPATNMIFINLDEAVPLNASQVAGALAKSGVLVGVVGLKRFRLVTHYWIRDEDLDPVVEAFTRVVSSAI